MGELKYEFLEHPAEVKFKAFGTSVEEAFENSALALSSFIAKGNNILSKKKKEIEVEASDKEALLYSFLEEIINLLDTDHFVVSRAKVLFDGKKLKAIVKGDDAKNYKGLDHVKAPTYSEMYIKKIKGLYELQVVVDV